MVGNVLTKQKSLIQIDLLTIATLPSMVFFPKKVYQTNIYEKYHFDQKYFLTIYRTTVM